MAGRLLFPAFPRKRALPWILGGGSAVAVIAGLVTGDSATFTIGTIGAVGCVIAFPLSAFLLRDRGEP